MRTSKSTKSPATLPIGRTARIAFEIDAARGSCCRAARTLLSRPTPDERELEDCARLEEALARAQQVLKVAVRRVMFSRLARRSRVKKGGRLGR